MRTSFTYSSKFLMWYPGHQPKAMMQLQKGLSHIDLVVEVRDARIPFSSTNPQFERILGQKKRLLLLNKSDLIEQKYQDKVRFLFEKYGNQKILFSSTKADESIKKVIKYAIGINKQEPELYPSLNLVLVGLPNVGKSSLLNRLRNLGVKKTQVGPHAGVTQTIQTRVKIWNEPPIYIVDTPGIFCPSEATPMQGLKIALTGGTKDRTVHEIHVADYLLFRLNSDPNYTQKYMDLYGLTQPNDDIQQVLRYVALKEGLMNPNGRFSLDEAANRFIRSYRLGTLGKMGLDPTDHVSVSHWFSTGRFPDDEPFMESKESS